MSKNDLRALYRTSEGRAMKGFVSPVGEVDEEQLKEMVAGNGAQPNSIGTTTSVYISLALGCPTVETAVSCPGPTENQCGLTYRPGDEPFC